MGSGGGGRGLTCPKVPGANGAEENFSSSYNGVVVARSGLGLRAWSPGGGGACGGCHLVSFLPGVGGGHRAFYGDVWGGEGGGACTEVETKLFFLLWPAGAACCADSVTNTTHVTDHMAPWGGGEYCILRFTDPNAARET